MKDRSVVPRIPPFPLPRATGRGCLKMCDMDPPPARVEPIAPWQTILNAFGLPQAEGVPSGVVGGWSHPLWRVDTSSGAYAIKELVESVGDWWTSQLAVAVAAENLAWNALEAYDATVDEAVATARDWAPLLMSLRPLVEELRSEFENLRDRAEPMLVMHRDVNPKNAVQRGDGVVALVDWDYAGPVLPASELLGVALSFAGGPSDADEDCVSACIDACTADSCRSG